MPRISALLLAAATLTAATVTPASAAAHPILDPVATASAYALTVNGQTEGLSRTAALPSPDSPAVGFFAIKHVVGPNALHPGWGVHLADQDVAPQFPNAYISLGVSRTETSVLTHRFSSIALTDSRGAFMAFSEIDERIHCTLDPEGLNGFIGKINFHVYLRNAQGEMVRMPGSGLGVAHDVPNVDAGDLATPDGQQRTTTVHFKHRVQQPAGLNLWRSEFPATYEAASGLHLVVTQQLGTEPPVVYDFLVGGGACGA